MFYPFFAAPLVIQIHIIAALIVAFVTPFQFWGFRKGSRPHRVAGYAWLTAIVVVALTSFGIYSQSPLSIKGFSLIHLLSIVTLVTSARIVLTARRGAVEAHFRNVRGLAIGFWIAAVFTLLPSRIMGQIVRGFFS
ncbi:MAG: DUF2306 domain-containing protein [Beijerinckiaceae bacterium]|jgi:uncharacterized membrane protein|nr:DUF2306 domain-containing protein [Beijerinckiaceae bacterium]